MDGRVFPEALPDVSRTAAALADSTRAAMCAALMDGRARTVGELARYTGVARSTASEHVDVLVAQGLVGEIRQGRHRYVVLAGEHTARLLEQLAGFDDRRFATPQSARSWTTDRDLLAGRTCYDHLAGRLGVDLTDALRHRRLIDSSWGVTPAGGRLLREWGMSEESRLPGAPCLDSTERRDHLGGRLGAAVFGSLLNRGWVARLPGSRAVRLTGPGASALRRVGLDVGDQR